MTTVLNSNTKDKTKNNMVYTSCGLVIFLLLVFFRNVFSIAIPSFLFLLVYVVLALISDKNGIAALCVALIPLSAVFQYKYAIFILVAVYSLKYTKDIKLNGAVVFFLALLIWELLHGLFYTLDLFETLRGFSELFLCTFFFCLNYKDFDYKLICRTLAWASIGVMLILLYQLLLKVSFDFEQLFTGSTSYRFGQLEEAGQYAGSFNPNGLGYICNLSILGLLQIAYSKKAVVLDYVGVLLLVFFGVLTLSRTFLVCLALILFLMIFCGKIPLKNRLKRLLVLCFFLTLVVLLVIKLIPTVLEGFEKRFQEDDLSNGRVDLFSFFLNHVFSSFDYLFFGIGMQDLSVKITQLYPGNFLVPHNGIIESLVIWGIPGVVFLFAFFSQVIIYSKLKKSVKLVNAVPLILCFVYIQAGQFFRGGIVMLSMLFIYFSCCYHFDNK